MNIHGYKKHKKNLVDTKRNLEKEYEEVLNDNSISKFKKIKLLKKLRNKIYNLRRTIINHNKIIKELKFNRNFKKRST